MKSPKSTMLAAVLVPLLLAGCEQQPNTTTTTSGDKPAAAAAPAAAPAAAEPAKATGPGRTVGFELVEPNPVGALQYDVEYTGGGRFVGDADAVACETKIEGALSSYNHIVDQKTLRAAFVSVKGFQGPMRVSECKFQGEVKAEDFKITVRDSSSPDLEPVDPPPTIKAVVD